jgi:hypothetical protein
MGTSCHSKTKTFLDKICPENNVTFIFTRYLYEKEEVKFALLVELLNKTEDALFWAYELYYSGFIDELTELLWKIYYDFYATLNPNFENYLIKIFSYDLTNHENEKLIFMIINDFIIKPYNVDVFILDQLRKTNIEKDYIDILSEGKPFL